MTKSLATSGWIFEDGTSFRTWRRKGTAHTTCAPPPGEPELAQRLERRAHLRREEQRLFPRREVPALVHLVEVGELRIAALRPAPGGLVDLAGEDGDRRRDGEVLGAEVRELVLPVAAGRGDPGVCEPVEGDVVEHVVPRQPLRGLSLGRRAHRHEA